jgi:hypothetical protein
MFFDSLLERNVASTIATKDVNPTVLTGPRPAGGAMYWSHVSVSVLRTGVKTKT